MYSLYFNRQREFFFGRENIQFMLEKLANCNVSLEKGNFCRSSGDQKYAALSHVMALPQNNRIIKNKLGEKVKNIK